MGDFLRSALVRSTKRVFSGVVLLDEPALPLGARSEAMSRDIWPASRAQGPRPDFLIACHATYLKGHTQGGAACDGGVQSLTFRAEIVFEIRDAAGNLIGGGTVSGLGAADASGERELPLTASFRGAMAEAVETLSGHLALALSSTPIPSSPEGAPAGTRQDEQYAETESGERAM
jgi:hypothetical protein